MTIYRTSERYPRSDVHAYEFVAGVLAPRIRTSAISIGRDEHQHLRKAAPVNRPLLCTLAWVASLPHDIRPTALLRDYARIANFIAVAWGDRMCLGAYMESLFTDNRGNRRGFPPDVLSELLALQRYYDTKDQDFAWDAVSKRG